MSERVYYVTLEITRWTTGGVTAPEQVQRASAQQAEDPFRAVDMAIRAELGDGWEVVAEGMLGAWRLLHRGSAPRQIAYVAAPRVIPRDVAQGVSHG